MNQNAARTPGQLNLPSAPLPSNTMAAVQLLDLFHDGDFDVDRIASFIRQNPKLAAETIKRCNSAVFRGAQPTTDVFEAVARLGYLEIYDIVTTWLEAREPRQNHDALPAE